MNTVISQVTVLFKNRRKSVLYVSLAILTAAVEEIFEQIVFKCPCDNYKAYGMAFIVTPALLLFFLGIVVDRDALVFLLPCTKSYSHRENERRTRRVERLLETMCSMLEFAACVCAAPMVWVILSLLRAQYYVCATSGPSLEGTSHNLHSGDALGNATVGCGKQDVGGRTRLEEQTYSQVLGCWLMVATTGIIVLLMVLRRFSRKRRQLYPLEDHIYQHIEAKAAMLQFHKRAKQMAEEKGRHTVEQCFERHSNDNYLVALPHVREEIMSLYNGYTIVPDSPTSPVVKDAEDGVGGPEDSDNQSGRETEEPGPANSDTSGSAVIDRERMYIVENRNMTRVIYLRETSRP